MHFQKCITTRKYNFILTLAFERTWAGRQAGEWLLWLVLCILLQPPQKKSDFSLLRTDYMQNVHSATMAAL